jgi:hypothetical protein
MKLGLKEMEAVFFFCGNLAIFKKKEKKRETCDLKVFYFSIFRNKNN